MKIIIQNLNSFSQNGKVIFLIHFHQTFQRKENHIVKEILLRIISYLIRIDFNVKIEKGK